MSRARDRANADFVVSETAPTAPFIGLQWYKATTGVIYQYTNDGYSSFWLDVSSGGIGTSASKSVDFAGDVDPHKSSATVAGGLVVGSVYYNRVKHKHFICTTATDDANVWSGRYDGWGGTITEYLSGSTQYKVHTFLTSGTFYVASAITADYLVVAGGGSGGFVAGGGGGAGGMLTAASLAVPIGDYTVTIGYGAASHNEANYHGLQGESSTLAFATPIVAIGGGGGGGGSGGTSGSNPNPTSGSGSGGGGAHGGTTHRVGGTGTSPQGYDGGDALHTGATYVGAGGGGTGAVGQDTQSVTQPGVGGAGRRFVMGYSDDSTGWAASTLLLAAANAGVVDGSYRYLGGGGGGSTDGSDASAVGGLGGGGKGGIAIGNVAAGAGVDGTGSGGGSGASANGSSPKGGSGIVIIRYAIT